MMRFIVHGVENLLTNFGISEIFRFRLMGQHLSDGPRDLATLTSTKPEIWCSCCCYCKFSLTTPILKSLRVTEMSCHRNQ